MALMTDSIKFVNDLRPCFYLIAKENFEMVARKALFHNWFFDEVHPEGVAALLEMEDGKMALAMPTAIRFADTGSRMAEYVFDIAPCGEPMPTLTIEEAHAMFCGGMSKNKRGAEWNGEKI